MKKIKLLENIIFKLMSDKNKKFEWNSEELSIISNILLLYIQSNGRAISLKPIFAN